MDCDAAKSYFAERGIEYVEKNIATSSKARRELLRLSGIAAVPTIVIGREVIWGFAANRERIEASLSRVQPSGPGPDKSDSG
jgi:glutaredoxin 3